jgi:NAD(P)-dependent dehydrogenase (short-subunit alcohol dehydrogenase family)
MERLKNKTAIITGGSGGIGKATAKIFTQEGAKVLLVDIDKDALIKAKDEIGSSNIDHVVADVTNSKDIANYAKVAKDYLGKVDIFFNNAGVEGQVKPITEYPEEEFQKVMDVNVKGVWLGLKHIIPLMNGSNGGSIIITSSVAGLMGTANVSPYVASKHATIGIMKSVALECAPKKIRVNTINPSPVDNRMMRSLEDGFAPGKADEAKKSFEQAIPLGRYAKSEEIGELALFLASDESKFITGTIMTIDGGMTA